MITVENDWIEYAPVPARRTAVRGGAVCSARMPVVASRPRAAAPTRAPGAPVAHRAARPARLRLTRRGRVVLVVLPAVLALSAGIVGISAPLAQADPAPVAPRTLVVGSGDTLWSIALRVAPQRDPRDVVAALERANSLPGAEVAAGARLVLPAGLAG